MKEPVQKSYISNALIGSIAHPPVIKDVTVSIKRNFSDDSPPHMRLVCHDKHFILAATCPLIFTISFCKKANED